MESNDSLERWYDEKKPLYEALARKVEGIVKENLDQYKIHYHSVTSRAKSKDSFMAKARSGRYTDPKIQIKDMSGIRIITYLESDVPAISSVIEKLFLIDKENSLDQSQLLGNDKIGYRSVHYVAEFTAERSKLPEYKAFKDLPFEIQIRSILQHAWAEIEHDRNYKFAGKLPSELQRRFYLVAGMLEVADREFVTLAKEVDRYDLSVSEELNREDLNIEINTISLGNYLARKFDGLIKLGLLSRTFGEYASTVVEELHLFGIDKLSQFDRITPLDFEDKVRSLLTLQLHPRLDFSSVTRLILIINDAHKYFEVSWRRDWHFIRNSHKKLLGKYKVDLVYVRKRVGLML